MHFHYDLLDGIDTYMAYEIHLYAEEFHLDYCDLMRLYNPMLVGEMPHNMQCADLRGRVTEVEYLSLSSEHSHRKIVDLPFQLNLYICHSVRTLSHPFWTLLLTRRVSNSTDS